MGENETAWEELTQLDDSLDLKNADEQSLVILAMGEACWISQGPDLEKYGLHVETTAAEKVSAELAAYSEEQFAGHPTGGDAEAREAVAYPSGWLIFMLWACSVGTVFYLQGQRAGLVDDFANSSKDLFDRHEWWRPFTSLFLHADILHLLGNFLSAAFFAPFVSRALGAVRAWLLILACGTLGNLLTAWTHYPEDYLSIGASTAIFGALGILAGIGFSGSVRASSQRTWMRMAAPVVAGFILLGWLGGGTEGGNTDVLAHAFGFSSGLISGFAAAEIQLAMRDARRSSEQET